MDDSDDRLVTDQVASEVLGVSDGTLRQWRYRGRGPAFIRVGSKVRYSLRDLREYIARGRVDPEDDTARAVG
jgi:hypothetical protein